MKDICLNCGTEFEPKLWGAKCNCNKPNVVHQRKCNGCNRIMGQITDDDFHGPEKLYCPDCIDKSRKKENKKIKNQIIKELKQEVKDLKKKLITIKKDHEVDLYNEFQEGYDQGITD